MHLGNWNPSITLTPAHLDISLADGVPSGGEPNGLGKMGHFQQGFWLPTNKLVGVHNSKLTLLSKLSIYKKHCQPCSSFWGNSWDLGSPRLTVQPWREGYLGFLCWLIFYHQKEKKKKKNLTLLLILSCKVKLFTPYVVLSHLFKISWTSQDVIFTWVQFHPRVQVWKGRF